VLCVRWGSNVPETVDVIARTAAIKLCGAGPRPSADALVGLLGLVDLQEPDEGARRGSGEPPHKMCLFQQ